MFSSGAQAACAAYTYGLAAVRHTRLPRLAVAGARRALLWLGRTSGTAGRADGRRAAARQHAVVRHCDRAVDGDRRGPGRAPFDQVLRAVGDARPTHLVGYASVIGRLARAAIAGELHIRPVRVSTNWSCSVRRTAMRSTLRGVRRSTTSGARPRSVSRQLDAPQAMVFTSARTR